MEKKDGKNTQEKQDEKLAEGFLKLYRIKENNETLLKKTAVSLFHTTAQKEEDIQNFLKKITINENTAKERKNKARNIAFSVATILGGGLAFFPALAAAQALMPIGALIIASRYAMKAYASKTEMEEVNERIDRNAFLNVKISKELQTELAYRSLIIQRTIKLHQEAIKEKDTQKETKYFSYLKAHAKAFKETYGKALQAEATVLPSHQKVFPKELSFLNTEAVQIRRTPAIAKDLDKVAGKVRKKLNLQIITAIGLDIATVASFAGALLAPIAAPVLLVAGCVGLGLDLIQTARSLKTNSKLKTAERNLFMAYRAFLNDRYYSDKMNERQMLRKTLKAKVAEPEKKSENFDLRGENFYVAGKGVLDSEKITTAIKNSPLRNNPREISR